MAPTKEPQAAFDLLLTGGRVIDPASGTDATLDVAFLDGKVAAIAPSIATQRARAVHDIGGHIVTPGLVDLHTHIYWGGTSLGVDPDAYARSAVVTTLVDAGSAGPGNFAGFEAHVIAPAEARILAYMNISFAGIFAFGRDVMVGECGDFRLLHAGACLEAVRKYGTRIVGIKVRIGMAASDGRGVAPLDLAIEVAEESDLPVMCHLDNPPPTRREVVERLRPGDVLTHCFRPFPGAPARGDGRVYDEIVMARERGIIFDIGHGKGSFGFASAESMLAAGIAPDCISSDVHSLSIDGPAHDLATTMSKLMHLGMPLVDVVAAATSGPARALRRPQLGRLEVGGIGDASVLSLDTGEFEFVDASGVAQRGSQRLTPRGRVQGGEFIAAA